MDDGESVHIARIKWDGESRFSADQIVSRNEVASGTFKTTRDLVKEALADGPREQYKVLEDIMGETTVTKDAVNKAASRERVLSQKEKIVNGRWWWALPQHKKELTKITSRIETKKRRSARDDGLSL
jgi:hypothetical protein